VAAYHKHAHKPAEVDDGSVRALPDTPCALKANVVGKLDKWRVNFILEQSSAGGGATVKWRSAVEKKDRKAARGRSFCDQRAGNAGTYDYNVSFARRF
jgi:hypothetical protein